MVTGMTVTDGSRLRACMNGVAQGVHGGDEWKRSPQHAGDGVNGSARRRAPLAQFVHDHDRVVRRRQGGHGEPLELVARDAVAPDTRTTAEVDIGEQAASGGAQWKRKPTVLSTTAASAISSRFSFESLHLFRAPGRPENSRRRVDFHGEHEEAIAFGAIDPLPTRWRRF
jgi:hypothetical protein